jgi:TonB family protein
MSEPRDEHQSDKLLLLAAAVVVGVGLTWLLISRPWSSDITATPTIRTASIETPHPAAAAEAPRLATAAAASRQPALNTGLGNPLRMAELAYEAGMLVEPEDYSAWTLFSKVLEDEPGNAAAREGLDKVAAELLKRGETALEQGRYRDAEETAERILAILPEHGGAHALAERIEAIAPKPAPAQRVAVASEPPPPIIDTTPAPAPKPAVRRADKPSEPPPDPLVAVDAAFTKAMHENRLLTPPNDNARAHLQQMIRLNPTDGRTDAARALYVGELLARSKQALEALDPDAAGTWIDAAAEVAIDQTAILDARIALNERLIAMESATPVPASDFELVDYVPPEYPRGASTRGLEGWVDVEFTVAANGTTRDIVVADASHERYFREEAIAAVREWRFEPRIFKGQSIDQRAYTRLRFVLANE